MSSMIPLQLFLSLSEVLELQNPIIVMKEQELLDANACWENSFPLRCIAPSAEGETLDYLERMRGDGRQTTLMLSHGNHEQLIEALMGHPLLFGENNIWIMSREFEHLLPLRLDSKVLLYRVVYLLR